VTVVALCFAPQKAGSMLAVDELDIVAGTGIVGDRYFSASQRHAGQNITLIEAEEIEGFNARNGMRLSLTDPRRNVITRNLRLNQLVGLEFTIGSTRFRGVELCEPCATLSSYLAGQVMTKQTFIREFAHRCGLRADILGSGRIRVGDEVAVVDAYIRPASP
jgi:MOSC domain-containing protein YiiM